jgi:Uma2 family endonuclease
MTVEEYLVWSESQQGRYELVDGVVYAQAAERAAHAKMKLAAALALSNAIRAGGLPCHVLPDGMAVRVGARTVFEPDALVYCGPELPPDALLVENPVIVVEIISPTTGRNDHTRKLIGYFALPSVRHYLIIDPDDRAVIHHERGDDGEIRTHILREGTVSLDPPGLTLPLSELYDA